MFIWFYGTETWFIRYFGDFNSTLFFSCLKNKHKFEAKQTFNEAKTIYVAKKYVVRLRKANFVARNRYCMVNG